MVLNGAWGGGTCSFCGRKVRGRRALSPGRPVGANVSCPPEPLSWPGPQPGLCPSSAPATSRWSSSGPKAVRALQPGGAEGGPAVPALTSPVAASRTAHRDQAPRTVLRGDGAAEASALPRRSDPHGRSANKARPAWRTEQDGAEGSGDSFPPRARGPPCGGQRWAGGRPLTALPRRAPLWPGPQPCALGPRQATCLLWRVRSEPSSRQSNLCLDGPRLRWRIRHGRVCVRGVGGGWRWEVRGFLQAPPCPRDPEHALLTLLSSGSGEAPWRADHWSAGPSLCTADRVPAAPAAHGPHPDLCPGLSRGHALCQLRPQAS